MDGRVVLVVASACLLAGCAADPGAGPDQGTIADGSSDHRDTLDTGVPCTTHHDCPQTWFCYDKRCIRDPLYLVYHCNKKDGSGRDTCPPGRRCVDSSGAKGTCVESTSYPCQDACDCGPAHCCVTLAGISGKRCVKDTQDPWWPGGKAIGGGSCTPGQDPTYCAADPACHVGLATYREAGRSHLFVSHDRSAGKAVSGCGGAGCFGTACNCNAGQSCVETVVEHLPPGRTCGLYSGGSCVSNAAAEAVFELKPQDLLPCCWGSCPKGQRCDAGWSSHRKSTYARVVGTCGSCGNGTCDAGEYPKTCAADCRCGDGVCSPTEIGWCKDCQDACGNKVCDPHETSTSCAADCYCGNKTCDVGESPTSCSDCSCGDGICSREEICAQDCVCPGGASAPEAYRVCGDKACGGTGCWDRERCQSCSMDCGKCRWSAKVTLGGIGAMFQDVWGSSASDVWAVGHNGKISHYDGKDWQRQVSPTQEHLFGVWGSSASDVWVVGGSQNPAVSVIARYDGKSWTPVQHPSTGSLEAVWGSSASDVWAAGSKGALLRFDGTAWKSVASPVTQWLRSLWGSSASDVWAGGSAGTLLHFDGQVWKKVAAPVNVTIHDLWGRSASDVWAVGGESKGVVLHYDGSSWKKVHDAPACLRGVWSSSASSVWAVGFSSILHFDGSSWKASSANALEAIWGSSASDIWAAGYFNLVHYDGKSWNAPDATSSKDGPARLWGTSSTDVWAIGLTGGIYHFDGKGWKRTASIDRPLQGLWGTAKNNIWVVGRTKTGNSSSIVHHDGTSWQQLAYQTDGFLAGVWGSSATDVWAVGGSAPVGGVISGRIAHFNGKLWSSVSTKAVASLLGVWGSSASNVWAVGGEIKVSSGGITTDGTILHYDGSAWSQVAAPAKVLLWDVWGSSTSNVWAVGGYQDSGALLHYDGKVWKLGAQMAQVPLASVHGRSAGDVWAVGLQAIFHHDGSAWVNAWPRLRMSEGTCQPLREYNLSSVWVAPGGEAFTVGATTNERLAVTLTPIP